MNLYIKVDKNVETEWKDQWYIMQLSSWKLGTEAYNWAIDQNLQKKVELIEK